MVPDPDHRLPAGGETPLGEIPADLIGYASDFVPYKPRGEVVVAGTAHAPGGRPVRGLEVKIQVGSVRKDLWVIGDHEWVDGRKTDIRPFAAMPLGYDRAYGGDGYARNPAGKGFAVVAADDGARYRPMLNLHRPDRLVDDPHVPADPVALGPIPASWPQRRDQKMGIYDQAWLDSLWPWFPADFDWSHFNAAAADQQIDGYWRGDEDLAFLNLHPAHSSFRTRLPGLRARCFWKETATPPEESNETEATPPDIRRPSEELADIDRTAAWPAVKLPPPIWMTRWSAKPRRPPMP